MSGLLNAFETLFSPPSVNPAVAAAVTVLTYPPRPPFSHPLEPALRAIAPHLADDERATWVDVLTGTLHTAAISGARCVAAFLGQVAVESAGFRSLEEDLCYSAVRLCEVWPNRFPHVEAAENYAFQPENLANLVYANRMGNGGEASGDGWRFRGRGLIQITGRTAYQHFALAKDITLDEAVEYAATHAGAAETAAWFWTANQLNALADTWSVNLITRKINGGMLGAAERARLSEAALQAIGE
jgi:putative chitinase